MTEDGGRRAVAGGATEAMTVLLCSGGLVFGLEPLGMVLVWSWRVLVGVLVIGSYGELCGVM